MVRDRDEHDPERFGIGRLFFLTTEAIVAADLSTEEAHGMALAELVPLDLRDAHLDGIRRFTAGGDAPLVGGRRDISGNAGSSFGVVIATGT